MSLSRWKMMAGVLGVSIGGLAAAASQCPKLDRSKGRSPDAPVAKADPKLPSAGAPSAPAPALDLLPAGPAIPAPPNLVPAGPTPAAPPTGGLPGTLALPAPPMVEVPKMLRLFQWGASHRNSRPVPRASMQKPQSPRT